LNVATNKPVLEVSGLTKIYGRQFSLGDKKIIGQKVVGAQDVSFSVNKGEIFGFLGPNGAGKTTTMRAILDYLHVQSGTVNILGFDHKRDRIELRKHIAYVPGDMSLFENYTGEEILQYFSKFRPFDEELLEKLRTKFRVNLEKKIKSLSKGNQQQVGLIAALASKPKILILDEPTSGLDPLMTANFHEILKKLSDEGITIFLSSHDLSEVQSICDRVGIIKEGKMILIESVSELKKKFLQVIRIEFQTNNLPSEETFKDLNTVISINKPLDKVYELKIKGDINELFKVLVNFNVKRFTCENATLEDIFLQFYK
jgi:ABC-2 type transport system ATP-binding protein